MLAEGTSCNPSPCGCCLLRLVPLCWDRILPCSWKPSRPGLMGFGATWSGGRCPLRTPPILCPPPKNQLFRGQATVPVLSLGRTVPPWTLAAARAVTNEHIGMCKVTGRFPSPPKYNLTLVKGICSSLQTAFYISTRTTALREARLPGRVCVSHCSYRLSRKCHCGTMSQGQ